jgi:hypothetical protein
MDRDRFDGLLLAELERSLKTAETLEASGDALPRREVVVLRRTYGSLQPVAEDEIDWRLTLVALTRVDRSFWDHMVQVTQQLSDDPLIEDTIGWNRDATSRALSLWRDVIAPLVELYASRRGNFLWDLDDARRLLQEWRAAHETTEVPHRSIAPLVGLLGPQEPVLITDDLAIRPMTDDDRQQIWRAFGPYANPSTISPDARELESWQFLAELRWNMPRQPPRSDECAHERINDLVSALRLHHPGVTGAAVIWTRRDPPDSPYPSFRDERLRGPRGGASFVDGMTSHIGPSSGDDLRVLIEQLQVRRADKAFALALRRFESAFERQDPADSLVDLWVAFEALLVPDARMELRYRAALRIARLVGSDAEDRQRVFKLALSSYDARSRVVHGALGDGDLENVTRTTRELVRLVLRRWTVNPPRDGVKSIDYELLA